MDHSGNLSQRKVGLGDTQWEFLTVSASFAIFHKYVILLQSTTRPLEMEVSPQTLDYQSPYNNQDHRIPGIIEYLGSSNSFGWLHVVPTWWLNCPLSNRIEKLVSQWSPVLPKWWNLVQFDFQQKHPGPAKDSPLHRGSSTKCAHRGWLCIAQGGGYPWKLQPCWEHLKKSKIIWYHPENNWGPIIDNLVAASIGGACRCWLRKALAHTMTLWLFHRPGSNFVYFFLSLRLQTNLKFYCQEFNFASVVTCK